MKTRIHTRKPPFLLLALLFLGCPAALTGPLAAGDEESVESVWDEIEEAEEAEEAEDVADATAPGRQAHMAELQKSPKRMQAFRKRWDVDRDRSISDAEYARYSEWQEKREALAPKYDLDGDGKVDPDKVRQFRQEVRQLNDSYFKSGPGKKKSGQQ
jgi:hypothetical protein